MLVFIRSNGRGYTFCNRFHPEQVITLTQSGTTLEDTKVRMEVKGRFNVLKSLMGFGGEILRNGEKQTKEGYRDATKGLAERLESSF